jgi:hypothetical protein
MAGGIIACCWTNLVTNGNNRLTIHIGSGIESSVLLVNIALHHRQSQNTKY